MNRVQQEDENGCGIACIAMAFGCSYKEIKEKLKEHSRFEYCVRNGTTTKQIAEFFSSVGMKIDVPLIRFSKKRIPNWEDLPFDALIHLRNRENPSYGHWMIFDFSQKKILDPSMEKEYPKFYHEKWKITSYARIYYHENV